MSKRTDIVYNDNTNEVLRGLEKAIQNGLNAIGMTAEGYAKKAITKQKAVDTGRLRNSITYALAGGEAHVKGYRAARRSESEKGSKSKRTVYVYSGKVGRANEKAVYIGTNVEYAPYVELGTVKMKARPYLRPAATEHSDEYKRLMEAAMKSAEQ